MSDRLALSGATSGSSAPGTPTVGLVVPPAHGRVPADAGALYPEGVRFVAGGLGLRTMTPADYARALTSLDGVVHGLVAGGAEAVSLMGTSLLSCGGLDTLTVIPDLEDRWGLPVVSSSQAGFWDAVQLVRPGIRADHPGLLFAA